MDRTKLKSLITENADFDLEEVAIQLFRYQYKHNSVYRNWVDNLNVAPDSVNGLSTIPFLPISAFKTHKLHCELSREEQVFESSGTTGSIPSRHYVFETTWYEKTAQEIFESFYGRVESHCFFALLPSYLERSASSLVAMVDDFISKSKYPESGFFLYDHVELYNKLNRCKENNIPTVLFGVSFALVDFVEKHSLSFPELVVIETGGMKGRKKEMTRTELHEIIGLGFDVENVHSEYGMTELFSQAYSKGNGVFVPGKTMSVCIKDPTDPLQDVPHGRPGVINIIDLANIDSCAFIETQDLGKLYADGSFEVLGRLDQSDIRGCNLMVV